MHEQEAKAQGVPLSYTLFDFNHRQWGAAELPTLLADAERDVFSGLNVTFPFKQTVVALPDELSDSARRIGAVNTVHFSDGKRIGHNTDVSGFAASLRSGLSGAALDCVVQIGFGGAGSATAHALMECGTKQLCLFDQDRRKAKELASYPSQPLPAALIAGHHCVADIVYFPLETVLLREAALKGPHTGRQRHGRASGGGV
jgi:shikimate dehydrogenase